MFLRIQQADYIEDYQIRLVFNDGRVGVVDLAAELYGEVFEPLRDRDYFRAFTLDGHTLTWPHGADFAPEFLSELLDQEKLPGSASEGPETQTAPIR